MSNKRNGAVKASRKSSAVTQPKSEPKMIAEFESSNPELVWPFEKDEQGYIADGKRVDLAGALRFYSRHGYKNKRLGYTVWDKDAFAAFLDKCADAIGNRLA